MEGHDVRVYVPESTGLNGMSQNCETSHNVCHPVLKKMVVVYLVEMRAHACNRRNQLSASHLVFSKLSNFIYLANLGSILLTLHGLLRKKVERGGEASWTHSIHASLPVHHSSVNIS
jgi:hypothetical protein